MFWNPVPMGLGLENGVPNPHGTQVCQFFVWANPHASVVYMWRSVICMWHVYRRLLWNLGPDAGLCPYFFLNQKSVSQKSGFNCIVQSSDILRVLLIIAFVCMRAPFSYLDLCLLHLYLVKKRKASRDRLNQLRNLNFQMEQRESWDAMPQKKFCNKIVWGRVPI